MRHLSNSRYTFVPQTDLEFLIERISKLPTRKELALRPLYIIAGSAGPVIACGSPRKTNRAEPPAAPEFARTISSHRFACMRRDN